MRKILTLVLLFCCVLAIDARKKSDRECEKELEAFMADALLPLEQGDDSVFELNSSLQWRYGMSHCRTETLKNEHGDYDQLGFKFDYDVEKGKYKYVYNVKLIDGKAVVVNRPGFTARHLIAGRWDMIVFQDEKGEVHDVLLKCKEHESYTNETAENYDIQDMFAGVWANDSNQVTVFGNISQLEWKWKYLYPGVEYVISGSRKNEDKTKQLKLIFVKERVKGAGSIDIEGGHTNGYRGNGSQHGPIIWWLKDVEGNLAVELNKPYDEELDAWYSKFRDPQFTLHWVRSPYIDNPNRWAVLSMRPVTRGILEFFDKVSLQQMLDYLNARENTTDIEKLNKSLIGTMLNGM